MRFSDLEGISKKWRRILVIGKTVEHDGEKRHIVGMTLGDEARLYMIAPFEERRKGAPKKKRTQRMILREREAAGAGGDQRLPGGRKS